MVVENSASEFIRGKNGLALMTAFLWVAVIAAVITDLFSDGNDGITIAPVIAKAANDLTWVGEGRQRQIRLPQCPVPFEELCLLHMHIHTKSAYALREHLFTSHMRTTSVNPQAPWLQSSSRWRLKCLKRFDRRIMVYYQRPLCSANLFGKPWERRSSVANLLLPR